MTYHLGVDLGTTYTAAATARDGRAQAVTLDSRSVAIPSVVYLDGDHLIVGQGAERRALTDPSRVAREFKRRVGDPTPILLGGSPVPAELLMARLLDWVVREVASSEGESPASLAVTHPANWGEYKLDLLRQAIRHVGLTVDHLIAEPVAAATFYASERDLPPGSVIAVYDLGGGTFDAAVVRVDQPTVGAGDAVGFRIVGQPEGIERLGGIDFDHAVLHHVTDSVGLDVDVLDQADSRTAAALAQLRSSCVEGKEGLSTDTDVSIPVMLPDVHTAVRLTRAEFEAMVRPGLDETLVALRRAVASADVEVEDLHAVLLVGGSSRIPLIAQMVMAQLGRPAAVDARPKEAISLGAALAASRAATPTTTVAPAPTAPGPTAVATPPTRELPAQSTGLPPPPSVQPSVPSSPAGGRASRAILVGLVAGIVVAAAVAAFLLTRDDSDGDAADGGDETTTTPSTESDEDEDITTTTTDADDDGDSTGSEQLEPLPGTDWNDEARSQFVEVLAGLDATQQAASISGRPPEELAECIYEHVESSGTTFDDFNEAWVAPERDPSLPGSQAMDTAAFSCGSGLG